MPHIAIIDSNRVGLRLLERARKAGHRVSFIRSSDLRNYRDTAEARAVIDQVDRVVEIPDTTRNGALLDAVSAVHADTPISVVITVEELSTEAAATTAAALGLPATDAAAVARSRDKYGLRKRAANAGIACGRSILCADLDAVPAALKEIGFPAVIKPAKSFLSVLAQIVMTPADAALAIDMLKVERANLPPAVLSRISTDFVVETFFEGPLVSAEVLRGAAGTYPLIASERLQPAHDPTIELGTILPMTFDDNVKQACYDYACDVIDAVGLDVGIFHVELILTADGPRLVELNPRLMGGSMPLLYDFLTGIHVHDLLIDTHLGAPVVPPALPPDRHVFSLRLQAMEPGRIRDLPHPADTAVEGIEILDSEMVSDPGDMVAAEHIIGRFYGATGDRSRLRQRVGALLDRCEARLGVALMRPAEIEPRPDTAIKVARTGLPDRAG